MAWTRAAELFIVWVANFVEALRGQSWDYSLHVISRALIDNAEGLGHDISVPNHQTMLRPRLSEWEVLYGPVTACISHQYRLSGWCFSTKSGRYPSHCRDTYVHASNILPKLNLPRRITATLSRRSFEKAVPKTIHSLRRESKPFVSRHSETSSFSPLESAQIPGCRAQNLFNDLKLRFVHRAFARQVVHVMDAPQAVPVGRHRIG